MEGSVTQVLEYVPSELQNLITNFEYVSTEPKYLPFVRFHNHSIPFKNDSQPFTIKLYRYFFEQKIEIERLVKEMMNSGVI